MNDQAIAVAERLQELLREAGQPPLEPAIAARFATFYDLLQRWNARTNLTAIRQEEEILSRHFIECIVCARALPSESSDLLDFGSGAGFPGIPIALCRPEIAVTLAESQGKKAAFLREAARVLDLGVHIHSGRAEGLQEKFSLITLRAVDKMNLAVQSAWKLLKPNGQLVLLTTSEALEKLGDEVALKLTPDPLALPGNGSRVLVFATPVDC